MSRAITEIQTNGQNVEFRDSSGLVHTTTLNASIQPINDTGLKITDTSQDEVIIYTVNIEKVNGDAFAGTTQQLWQLLDSTIFNG